MRYLSTLLIGLLSLFVVQMGALHAVGGRTVKSESNYFSSLGRIQAGAQNSPEIMILGSSITGRLPDRAQGFDGVANLGCDGGSAVDTIRAVDEGRLPRAPVVVVEANTLQVALKGESEVAVAMRSPWFRAGLKIPLISAYARPAAFLYSPLLATRTGGYARTAGGDLGTGSTPVEVDPEWLDVEVAGQEAVLAFELAQRLQRLEERGSRVVIVWLPPARSGNRPPSAWIQRMVAESGTEWWDLGQEADPGQIVLTDQIHMDAESAAKTLRSILAGL